MLHSTIANVLNSGELYSTFIVACLPSMLPLFKVLSKLLTGNSSAAEAVTWESRTANQRKGGPGYEMLMGGKSDAVAKSTTRTPSVSDSATDTVDIEALSTKKGIRKTSERHDARDQRL